MESTGEEKKLQALFSELKAADEETAPRFARAWNHAASEPRRSGVLKPAFVAGAVFVLCAAGLIFAWSRSSQSTQPPPRLLANVDTAKTGPATVNPGDPSAIASTPGVTIVTPSKPARPSKTKASARRQATQLAATRKLTREAKAISAWESPTLTLLSFTDDELFTSLPQLNENASDLQSFLPSRPN